jgi:cytochrome c-type biogenesis protein CcmH/NrfG
MSRENSLIRERIAQAEQDIRELAEQVEQGEIDASAAAELQRRYERERESLLEHLAQDEQDPGESDNPPLLSGARLIGIGIVAAAVLGLGVWLISTTGNKASGVEGLAADVVSGNAMNLDDISNEQMEEVVAQNPDIAPMRLALAERYFVEGDFPDALRHYMYVLDTLGVKDPTALANVGWMTYLSDVPDVAESFVEESLAIQPDGGIAFWYLASIRFYGLDDPGGAVEPLQKLLEYDELPDEIRAAAEDLLAQAEAAS